MAEAVIAASMHNPASARPDIPLIEEYRGASYKSLVLCCLESATGEPARVTGKNRIEFGGKFLPVDRQNVHYAMLEPLENLQVISFASLVSGRVSPEAIAGHVVIIGWDSPRTPTLPTPFGPMRIHRLFVQCLAATWRALSPISPQTPPALP
jgi:hypothetical protein